MQTGSFAEGDRHVVLRANGFDEVDCAGKRPGSVVCHDDILRANPKGDLPTRREPQPAIVERTWTAPMKAGLPSMLPMVP